MITPPENNGNPIIAAICWFISFLATALAWVSLHEMQVFCAICASLVAFGSGILGGVNFWYSIKEKRINIKKLNQTP